MQKRRFFNMVEILLAMGVTAIGIAGLCSVLPVGLISSRDAYQSGCVCVLMTDIYDRINHWCGTRFDQLIADEYDEEWHRPLLKPAGADSMYNSFNNATNPANSYFEQAKAYEKTTNAAYAYNGYTISKGSNTGFVYATDRWRVWPPLFSPSGTESVPFTTGSDVTPWSANDGTFSNSHGISWRDRNGKYNYWDSSKGYTETGTLEPGLLKFRVFNDFSGEVRIWKQIPSDVSGCKNSKEKKLVRIYLEFSYPSQAAYVNRTKRTFVREFYSWRSEWVSKAQQ